MITPEEEWLVDACLQQDRKAQKMLYDRYKDAMYTLSLRITGDRDLASDALQEAFLGVFRGLDKFRRASTLGAWIKTIVVRHAYKRLKKEIRTINWEEAQVAEPSSHILPLEAEYLEKAIEELPLGYRTVFVLTELEGYKHHEVADILGIATGTSKSQLYHAKKMLRNRLGIEVKPVETNKHER
ncbi:MAG: sigma-70 family RNA polymerase sigma factor [Bacteroidota bacterium]